MVMRIKLEKKRYLFVPILTNLALSVNIERVVTGREVIKLAGRLDNLLDPRIAELDHIARIHVDQMVVLHAAVSFLELGDVLAELMFYHKAAVQQKLNGIVQRGPAYPVVLVLHEDIEGFYIEVAVPGIDLVQNGIAFGCLTVPLSFKIISEDLLDSLFGLLLHHT